MITTNPVVIVGVNRKVNTGNFENIDLYCGLALPVESTSDLEALTEAITKAVEEGFHIAAQETFARYQSIKEMQQSGRK